MGDTMADDGELDLNSLNDDDLVQQMHDDLYDGLKEEIGFREVIADEKTSKLSIVGVGMRSHSGVAAKMFETLAKENVNIEMISTSEIKISVLIDLAKGEQAMQAVHAAFLE